MISCIAYHGTDKKFEQFNCPAYFSGNRMTAEFFAKRADENSYIFQCRLNFEKPLVVDLNDQSWGGFFLHDEKLQMATTEYAADGDPEELECFKEEGLTVNFLAEYAKSEGYDGLVLYNCLEEDGCSGTQFVVFSPENITIEKITSV